MSKKRSNKQKTENSDDKYTENVIKYQVLVNRICDRFVDVITEELKDLTPKIRWLIYSRVINLIFQNHYGAGMSWAEETVKLNEGNARHE